MKEKENAMFNMSAIATAAFHFSLKKREYGELTDHFPQHLIENLRKPVRYSTEASAAENGRTLISMWYSTIGTVVSMMDANDGGGMRAWHLDELADPSSTRIRARLTSVRQETIDTCLLRLSVIESVFRGLEAAGWRDQPDALHFIDMYERSLAYRFKPYHDAVKDIHARLIPGSLRARQLERAAELELSPVDHKVARGLLATWFQDEPLFLAAQSAWMLLMESLEECGLELQRHERAYTHLNNQLKETENGHGSFDKPPNQERDIVMKHMSAESTRHRDAMGFPGWLLRQRLEPMALLRHAGVPVGLIESVEWQQEEAQYQSTIKAEKDALVLAEQDAEEKTRQAEEALSRARQRTAALCAANETKGIS